MYGEMQEPVLTEIIPFIGISAIWGPVSTVFHIPLSPASSSVLKDGCLIAGIAFLGTRQAEKFMFGGPESLMAVTSLFADMAGNAAFLSSCQEESWGLLDRGIGVCKSLEVRQPLASSGNHAKAKWLEQFSEWMSSGSQHHLRTS